MLDILAIVCGTIAILGFIMLFLGLTFASALLLWDEWQYQKWKICKQKIKRLKKHNPLKRKNLFLALFA